MKKRTSVYLWLIIVIFVLILIPYFQNAGGGSGIGFYFMTVTGLTDIYLYILSLGIIEGVLITLYITSFIKDVKEQDPTKFDLNQ